MSKILIPSQGASDWQRFLAQPELQWAKGYSARTLAYSWEAGDLPPSEVLDLMEEAFGPGEYLLGIPEYKTPLPGGSRQSQSDVFVLMRHEAGLAAYTIEGKVDEPFGPTVGEWSTNLTSGKRARLAFLCEILGIPSCPPHIHYQLLHRTASALIEAERFDAGLAGMIVHSFSPNLSWFEEFRAFAELLGFSIGPGEARSIQTPSGKRLMIGWAKGEEAFRLR